MRTYTMSGHDTLLDNNVLIPHIKHTLGPAVVAPGMQVKIVRTRHDRVDGALRAYVGTPGDPEFDGVKGDSGPLVAPVRAAPAASPSATLAGSPRAFGEPVGAGEVSPARVAFGNAAPGDGTAHVKSARRVPPKKPDPKLKAFLTPGTPASEGDTNV